MTKILLTVWRLIKGPLQWYVLWFFHSKFIVGVSGVVLNDKKEILLLRHRFWKKGSWGLPSGYAIKSEKLEDSLKREVKEETNLDIEVMRVVRMVSGYKLRIEVSFFARLLGGDMMLDDKEVLEAKFFSLTSLPDTVLESHKEIIKLALNSDDFKTFFSSL